MKKANLLSILFVFTLAFSSCTTSNIAMKQPNNHIEFYKNDFQYSEQVSGEATSVKILMIDWARLFGGKTGDVSGETSTDGINISVATQMITDPILGVVSAVIPVLGEISKNKVSNLALYELMKNNPGYDVVIYPQYETQKFSIPLIYSKTTVKVKARLGKIK